MRKHGAGLITSPGSPEPYFENANCTFLLSVDEGQQLVLKFTGKFDVEGSDGQCVDYVKVRVEIFLPLFRSYSDRDGPETGEKETWGRIREGPRVRLESIKTP